jgi:hypothetical protein
MRTVVFRVGKADLADRMAAMRTWLDERGFGSASFRCNDLWNGEIDVRLKFERNDHAEKFGAAFTTKAESTILVVDDEPDIRQVVGNTLTYNGFNIIEAGSGTEALYKIRSNIKIDLLFTDIVMPGEVDGFHWLVMQENCDQPCALSSRPVFSENRYRPRTRSATERCCESRFGTRSWSMW